MNIQNRIKIKTTSDRPFHILSKPVGALCNMKCDYCFYLNKKEHYPESTRFDMSLETLEAHIKNYIQAQPAGCREVTFGWQGGEPTMRGLGFYRHAVALQKKHRRAGMNIVNTIQTNGLLLNDEWAAFFSRHRFLVGISIDGDHELHDRYRKNNSGRGSYQQVVRGLRVLQKHNVETNILTVIQNHNGDFGARVYGHLKQLGAQFIQFIPVVEAVAGQGVSGRSVTPEQFGQFMIDVFDEWRKEDIGQIFIGHFDNALGMHLGMPSSSCVHSRQCGDNLVMEHNGDVYSCDHFVYPAHKVGNINHLNYPDLIETAVHRSFSQRKLLGSQANCMGCSQRSLCHGACPAQRIDEQGELSVTAGHYLCSGYYKFFSYIRPYLNAMGICISNKISPVYYQRFMS